MAGTIVAESSRPRREVVLITDFQKNGWTPSDDQRLPAGTTFSPVAVGDGSTINLSVAPAAVRRARFEGQERATVTGGVTNRGTEPATGVTLALEIDGRVAETARVDVAAQASASHVFAPVTVAPAGLRGVVRLADDALAADNAFHFVLRESRPVAVLLAGPSGAPPTTPTCGGRWPSANRPASTSPPRPSMRSATTRWPAPTSSSSTTPR